MLPTSGLLVYLEVKVQATHIPHDLVLEVFGTYPFVLSLSQIPLVSSHCVSAGMVLGR